MSDHHNQITDRFHQLDDGKRMRYRLYEPASPPRGTIVIAPGRREFVEKKYAELGREFLERGLRVIAFDWRGQGLSDRFLSGENHQHDHITDFDIYLRDFRSFYDKVIKLGQIGPLLLSGHSMGGHLILRWMAENHDVQINGALLTSPMMALAALPVHAIAHAVSWIEVKLGNGEDYATGQHDYNDRDRNFTVNPLTHDRERFAIIQKYFDENPAMAVGGVTWDWLLAALKSMHTIQRRSYLQSINIPVLTLMGGSDSVTPTAELSHYLGYLPQSQSVIISGAMHDIMNESDVYRLDAWRYIDLFLERLLPAKA